MFFKRMLSTAAPPPAQGAARRVVSFPAPPKYWLNVPKRNALVAVSLLTFVGSVFYYTLYQLRNANHLGVEFDEKLDKSKQK